MTAQLQLNVFGSPELVRDGRSPVRFRTKKHLAVLLYLHFEGRAHSIPRDRLVDLLWPDVPPDKGRHSLSQALFAIRSRLGSGAVTGKEKEGVQLLAELPSDLSALREGRLAKLRVAEPLQGLEDCGGTEFSHWVDAARARVRTQARDTLRAALHSARTQGNSSETQLLASALYDIDPLCVEAVCALAERALFDGDPITAVRLLNDQVQRAKSELGTNPNPEIVRLLRRLERGDRPAFPTHPAPTIRPHPFVARGAELARLEAIANRVADTAGFHSCLIRGAPGIGKTSLIRRFATSLEARAWPVFTVACQEIGQGIPYAAAAELITALARDPAAGGTEPLWLAEASRVCPGLRVTYPGVPQPPDAPTDSIRLRVAEAVLHMIEAVADNGPVLLAFDDLQFLDPASQDVMFLVTRGLSRVPALILAGARLGEWEREGLKWGETIELGPLDRSQALSLMRDLSVDSADPGTQIRETIVRLSQGNPYHIEMLVSDWRTHQADSLVAAESIGDGVTLSWTPPEDLRAAFARQYGGLSSDAQHVLQVLAVAGKAMAPHDVSSLLGLDAGARERVVLELLDRGVGRVEEGRLSFKNELHRAYVYHAMGTDRRTYHHAQFAQRLGAADDRHELQTMLELVHHSIGAGLERQAMETGIEAAEIAIAHGAPREAERLLTWLLRAYGVAPGSRLRLLLAHALVTAAHYQRAVEALAEWRADDASPTDRALAALIRADAMQRARLGSDEAIMTAAQEAIALAEAANATAFLVRANYIRLEISFDCGNLTTWDESDALAAKIAASGASPECVALSNLTLGQSALSRGDLVKSVESLTGAEPVLESLGLQLELRRVLNILGISYKCLGRFEDAAKTFQKNLGVAERSGHQGAVVQGYLVLGHLYDDLAYFDSAADCYRACLAPLENLTSRAWAEAFSNITRLALVLGNLSEAELSVQRCEEGARRSGLWRHRVTALTTRADFHVCNGQPELAWPLVEEAATIAEGRSHLLPDAGFYERLQRQCLWATRGYYAMKSLSKPFVKAMSGSLIEALEVSLFDEAVRIIAGDSANRETPRLDDALAMGVFGPLARLIATGVHHPNVPARRQSESAAQLIARVYPHPQRSVIPNAIGLTASETRPAETNTAPS